MTQPASTSPGLSRMPFGPVGDVTFGDPADGLTPLTVTDAHRMVAWAMHGMTDDTPEEEKRRIIACWHDGNLAHGIALGEL